MALLALQEKQKITMLIDFPLPLASSGSLLMPFPIVTSLSFEAVDISASTLAKQLGSSASSNVCTGGKKYAIFSESCFGGYISKVIALPPLYISRQ